MNRPAFVRGLGLVGCVMLSATTACAFANPSFEPAVGGGFAGLRVPVVSPTPVMTCADVCTPNEDVVLMKGDYQYSWRPAVTTGLVVRPSSTSVWGIGAQLVAAPVTDKATRLAPGFTLHYGKDRAQLFLGPIFMPSDAYELPEGGVRVPRGTDPNLFIRSGGTTKLNMFVGISVAQ
jgi:hypothetical protein